MIEKTEKKIKKIKRKLIFDVKTLGYALVTIVLVLNVGLILLRILVYVREGLSLMLKILNGRCLCGTAYGTIMGNQAWYIELLA